MSAIFVFSCETSVSICITFIFGRADFMVLTSSISGAAHAGGFVVWVVIAVEKTLFVAVTEIHMALVAQNLELVMGS